jgi:phage baseplate assembly protein W|tara:strand:+ start:4 stop:441 length:438 start_codon:yes stop_codon:yes gene_type:complete
MRERTEYRYNPIDFNDNVAVGVTLPYGKLGGLFNLSYTTEEQSVSNLKNLLLTRKGERPFQPEFGSDVYSLLFENIGLDLSDRLSESLREDINLWLPYIIIDDIIVDTEPDRNYVKIQLSFRVTEQGANQQIVVFVDSAGTTTVE